MKCTTTTCLLALLPCFVFSQNIQIDRITAWPNSSLNTINISTENVIDIQQLGADASGETSIDDVLNDVISSLGSDGGVLYLSEGNYLINQTINLPSNTYIIGDGANNTNLIIDLKGVGHAILAKGSISDIWFKLEEDAQKGSNQLVVGTHNNLKAGDLIRLRIKADECVTSSWAKGTVGQITRISAVDGSTIVLEDQLRLDLPVSDKAELAVIKPVTNCGLVNLSMIRKDVTSAQTDNIRFEYTSNAMVYGVDSRMCNFAHLNNVYAYESYVYGSYFNDAFDFGSGGKAYGVVISFTSSQCVIENNIFDKLRHSILFQAGPNGNVVGYNYSKNPHWTATSFPSDFAGDVVMHGNYPFHNLIEGNVIQNLVIDNSHGINGPNNVFMRNRIEHAGLFMNDKPASNNQIFIGNEITGTGTSSNGFFSFPKGLYMLAGTGHIEYTNNVNGKILPDGTPIQQASYYHQYKPSFFKQSAWPSVGYPSKLNVGSIPAYQRAANSNLTVCYPFKNPLKTSILSFSVLPDRDGNQLEWTIGGDESCPQFEIYRIQKNNNPDQIATINCESNTLNSYDFTYKDVNLAGIEGSQQIGYYVIMSLSDGREIDSDTIYVQNNMTHSGIHVDQQGYMHTKVDVTHIQLHGLNGRLLCDMDVNQALPSDLSSGIYYARLFNNSGEVGLNKIFIRRQ